MTISNGGKPLGAKLLFDRCCPVASVRKLNIYRIFILLLTFLAYTCYHMSRKPISVVKTKLVECHGNEGNKTCDSFINQINGTNEDTAKRVEGWLDTSFLISYAICMFISGFIAERVDLRYFLSVGMLVSGLFTMLFGFGKYWGIHDIGWYIFVQIVSGAFQSTGWPGVVTIVANWFGKGKKGLIFGIWNSHTSVGNIVGSLLAGAFVEDNWGLSFIVPGIIIASVGILFFFVLVPKPEVVGLNVDAVTPEAARLSGETSPLLEEPEDENEFGHSDSDVEYNVERSENHERPADVVSNISLVPSHEEHAISFVGALKIPGVVEFALCLFFAKLVSYTFLYWLPTFIIETGIDVSSENAAYMSTLFDVGGIIGGIMAGLISDLSGRSASTCAIMLIAAIPVLFGYESYGNNCQLDFDDKSQCYGGHVGLLMLLGLLVNGPYALITTAVSAELGTHPSLHGSAAALATVTAIIDGTGSVGAAVGPFLAGAVPELDKVFYILMIADVFALLLLSRLVKRDIQSIIRNWRSRGRSRRLS